MNPELFKADIAKALKAMIAEKKRDGTVNMSADNAWQCVRIRSQHSPLGTNARWLARQLFDEVLSQRQFRAYFEINMSPMDLPKLETPQRYTARRNESVTSR